MRWNFWHKDASLAPSSQPPDRVEELAIRLMKRGMSPGLAAKYAKKWPTEEIGGAVRDYWRDEARHMLQMPPLTDEEKEMPESVNIYPRGHWRNGE